MYSLESLLLHWNFAVAWISFPACRHASQARMHIGEQCLWHVHLCSRSQSIFSLRFGGSWNRIDFSYPYVPQEIRDRPRKCTNLWEFRLLRWTPTSPRSIFRDPSRNCRYLSLVPSPSFTISTIGPITHPTRRGFPTWSPSDWISIQRAMSEGLEGELLGWGEYHPRELSPDAFDMWVRGRENSFIWRAEINSADSEISCLIHSWRCWLFM